MTQTPRSVILGGGPAGLACALMLARSGRASVVLDAQPQGHAHGDRRLLALARGSWEILRPLLKRMPDRASITDVHVSSSGEFGTTHIGARDLKRAELGATTFYGDLVAALEEAAADSSLIALERPRRVIEVQQAPRLVRVVCADADPIEATLAIDAEGGPRLATTSAQRIADAAPVALVGDVDLTGIPEGCAFERFTRDGPLALLPRPGAAGQRSLVWCMPADKAERRLTLAPAALRAELQSGIGSRIAGVNSIGGLRRYVLYEQIRQEVQSHRSVAVGNAAQTLHPVAGQGFNLALRDCASLIDCLIAHADDVPNALAEYARRRRIDRTTIATLTHWLPQIFATRFAPVAAARALGLTVLDLVPPLRNELAQLLMFGVR